MRTTRKCLLRIEYVLHRYFWQSFGKFLLVICFKFGEVDHFLISECNIFKFSRKMWFYLFTTNFHWNNYMKSNMQTTVYVWLVNSWILVLSSYILNTFSQHGLYMLRLNKQHVYITIPQTLWSKTFLFFHNGILFVIVSSIKDAYILQRTHF